MKSLYRTYMKLYSFGQSFSDHLKIPNRYLDKDGQLILLNILVKWRKFQIYVPAADSSAISKNAWFFPFNTKTFVTRPNGNPKCITSVSLDSFGIFLMCITLDGLPENSKTLHEYLQSIRQMPVTLSWYICPEFVWLLFYKMFSLEFIKFCWIICILLHYVVYIFNIYFNVSMLNWEFIHSINSNSTYFQALYSKMNNSK